MSNVYFALLSGNFAQNWADAALIATSDDWAGVPSIIGYRGDGLTGATGTDPQTVLGTDATPVVDVNANQTNPNTFTTGGVTEFAITDPTIALAGSGTARVPYIVLHLDTTGVANVAFSFRARDLETGADNAIQQVAVQYRVGETGAWMNLPAGYIADATSGPNLAGADTPVSVALPSEAWGQPKVQLRVLTTDAVGSDEWVGIDDLLVTSTPAGGPTVSIADAAIAEGNAGTTPLVFTLTRTDTAAPATVDYAVTFPSTASAGDVTGALTGTASFAAGSATTTVTVQVVGDTASEPNETFQVTLSNPSPGLTLGDPVATGTITNDDLTITRISAIQGAGAATPLLGQTVTIEAIVVGDFQDGDGDTLRNLNGFFVQEEKADWDLNGLTSEGIFIFQNSLAGAVNIGDLVQVTGVVGEAFGQTQITMTNVTVLLGGAVGDVRTLAVDVTLPEAGVTGGGTNPDLERYEGMIVSFPQTLTINEMFNLDRFNEITLVAGERPFQYTHDNAPSATGNAQNLERIGSRTVTYDDGEDIQNRPIGNLDGFAGFTDATAPSMGDTVSNLTGVLNYTFSEWHVRSVADGSNIFADTQPREQAPPARGGSLDIASFNVLNFFRTLDLSAASTTAIGLEPRGANTTAEFDRQVSKLITALSELNVDIYGLIELENDFTPGAPGNAIELIVDRLNLATGKTFAYVAPGGQFLGGDAIAVGYIYDTAQVRIAPGTTVQVLDNADIAAGLLAQSSIGTIFNGANTSRAALAVTWQEIATGEVFTSALNHFKSKSGTGTGLDADAGDGAGNWNNQRLLAAKALDAWLATNPTGTADRDTLILGDLNSYFREAPIAYLEGAGYENLQLRADDPYSYVFDGQLGALDYILANQSLAAQVATVAEWHLNSNEADALDYNLDFGRASTYFSGSEPFRVSDHDPVVVSLSLGAKNAGNDFVIAGAGQDSLAGGLGDDFLGGEGGNDTLVAGQGNDVVLGGDGQDLLQGDGGDDYILGGIGNDSLSGAGANDALYGDAGDDTIDGGGENDVLVGGDGKDVIIGDDGDDYLLAGLGDDSLSGGYGTDRLYAEAGNDTLSAGGGNDVLVSGEGNDRASGDDGDDYLLMGGGGDTASGGAGADRIDGEAGDDSLAGGAGDDVLVSGDGQDSLSGDNGDDYLLAGIGDDDLSGGNGVDRLYGEAGDDTLAGGADNDVLVAGDGNDLVIGEDGDDYAEGGAGDDSISGDAGIDRAYGGAGNDSLSGGTDNDVLLGGEDDDAIFGGGENDWMQGENGNDRLVGGDGDDYLDGGIGADTLEGSAGNDALVGGGGTDIFLFRGPGDGGDAIIDFVSGEDRLLVTNIGFGGGLGSGPTLDPSQLVAGTVATQAFGQFLYDQGTGVLRFDVDGTGAQAASFIAQLYGTPGLTAGAILVQQDIIIGG